MKKVFALILLFSWNASYSQVSRFFEIIGDTAFNNIPSSVNTTADGGYIIGGYIQIPPVAGNYLIKLDKYGSVEWKKEYAINSEALISDVIQTSDNGYIFTGHAVNHTLGDLELVKTDGDGNLEWSHTYNAVNGFAGGVRIIEDHNSFFIIGDIDPATLDYEEGLLFMRVDQNGNLIWSSDVHHTDPNSLITFGSVVTHTNDGYYMTEGAYDIFNGYGSQYMFIKYDEDGNQLWKLLLNDTADYDEAPVSIRQLPDNDFISVGFNMVGLSSDNLRAFRMDDQGSVIWEKKYFIPGMLMGIPKAYTTADGITVITSEARDSSGIGHLCALLLDGDGNIKNTLLYSDSIGMWGADVVQAADGGFAFTGGIYFGNGSTFILKTDDTLGTACRGSRIEFQSQDISLISGTGGTNSSELIQFSCTPTVSYFDTSSLMRCFDLIQTDSVVVPPLPGGLYVPDAFTPNNDGLNDVFYPVITGVDKYQLTIFDRWGELIFDSVGANSGWNGTYKNRNCEEGVYVWKLEYSDENGQSSQLIGHVVLLR